MFSACSTAPEVEFIAVDYSQDLVGTWTCHTANYSEALVIKADGTALSTGVENGEYWKNVKGSIKVVNNKITMTFEDGDNYEGRIDIVPGVAFSIFNDEEGRYTYNYCKHDISNDVLGVWVCNDTADVAEKDMAIANYQDNERALYTGLLPGGGGEYGVNNEESYNVVGDMMFRRVITRAGTSAAGGTKYIASQLVYTPRGTAFGDVLTERIFVPINGGGGGGGGVEERVFSWLRVKQTLSLQDKKYNYSSLYVTNVSGKNETINILDYPFNFAELNGDKLDKMLKATLFNIEFSHSEEFTGQYTMQYRSRYNDFDLEMDIPAIVDGNKMTLDMKAQSKNPDFKSVEFRNVELYTFQDADDSQMHMYMSKGAFIGFFGNMQVVVEANKGNLDLKDPAAVAAIYARLEDVVESINLSFVFKIAK